MLVSSGAGLYFGDESSFNGPLLFARRTTGYIGGFPIGVRVAFRDDKASGGRIQALSVGPEVVLFLPLNSGGFDLLYFPVGVSLDIQSPSGIYPRFSVGYGFTFGTGRGSTFFVEGRRSLSAGGNYSAITFGAGSLVPNTGRSSRGVVWHGNAIQPFGSTYVPTEDFRGYTISYDVRQSDRVELRGSIGIDFLDFPGWSTGAISLLVGPRFRLASLGEGEVSLYTITQGGVLLFVEGEQNGFPLAASTGLELVIGSESFGVLGGANLVVANGPAGTLAGWQPRLGMRVGI